MTLIHTLAHWLSGKRDQQESWRKAEAAAREEFDAINDAALTMEEVDQRNNVSSFNERPRRAGFVVKQSRLHRRSQKPNLVVRP